MSDASSSSEHVLSHSKSAPTFDSIHETPDQNSDFDGKCSWLPRWVPSSGMDLAQAENRLLQGVRATIDRAFVRVAKGQLWTAKIWCPSQNENAVPLVLVHGFAGGIGVFANNYDQLSVSRTVYAFDLLGFGRSSRPRFAADPAMVELDWVQSMEEWRKEMQIQQMVLLGHSLGGFLCASYAIEYPSRVRHLILADPWGLPPRPVEQEEMAFKGVRGPPKWLKPLGVLLKQFNPLATVRAVGPLGPALVRKARPDLGQRYASEQVEEDTVFSYIYHCNAQKPSGETAFKELVSGMGWAKRPMRDRLTGAHQRLPITFLYGERTWMDDTPALQMKEERKESYTRIEKVSGAGHQMFADNPQHFNQLVSDVCDIVDQNADQ